MLHTGLFKQGDRLDARSEILPYGHNHQIDILKRKNRKRRLVGRVNHVYSRYIIFHGFHIGPAQIHAYHFVAHIGKVAGKVSAIYAKSYYKIFHSQEQLYQLIMILSSGR